MTMRGSTNKALVVVAVAGVVAIVAALALIARARSKRPLQEVAVDVRRRGSAVANEREIADALEQALGGAEHLRSIRSETTASGVHVSCSFDPLDRGDSELAVVERVRSRLERIGQSLPADAPSPMVMLVRPTKTFFVGSEQTSRERLLALPGAAAVETCGGPGIERSVVRVDLARLNAMGVDLLDVARAPLTRGGSLDAIAIREQPTPVFVRDVAIVGVDHRRPPCDMLPGYGARLLHVVRVYVEHEKAMLEAARASGEAPRSERDVLGVRIALVPGAMREQHARALAALVRDVREATSLVPFGVMLRDDEGELLFDADQRATRANVDRVRAIVARHPGLAWAGGFGVATRGVKRVRADIIGTDLAALERTADDLRKRLQTIDGVVALVRLPSARVPASRLDVDRTQAARLGISVEQVLTAARIVLGEDEMLGVDRPGVDALSSARIKGVSLSSLVRITNELEPLAITHVERRRAIELEWEVDDARATIDRVQKEIARTPQTIASLVD